MTERERVERKLARFIERRDRRRRGSWRWQWWDGQITGLWPRCADLGIDYEHTR